MEEYILYHEIGKGHTTATFKGRKSNTLDYLALLQTDKNYAKQAAVRYAAAQLVSSPHVCKVDLHCDTGQEIWLVAELCTGISLRTVVKADGHLTGGNLKHIYSEMLQAIAACHSSGLIVGDIRLDKFLVQDGHVKLCSLARALTGKSLPPIPTTPSPTGITEVYIPHANMEGVGSLIAEMERIQGRQYLAPEIQQEEFITQHSDIWSLGIAILELMIGREIPPPGADAVLHEENLRDVANDLGHPPELVDLVLNMLHRNVKHRWCWKEILSSPLLSGNAELHSLAPQLVQVDALCKSSAISSNCNAGPRMSISSNSRLKPTSSLTSFNNMCGSKGSQSSSGSSATIVQDDNDPQDNSGEDWNRVSGLENVFSQQHLELGRTRKINPHASLILSRTTLHRHNLQRPATTTPAMPMQETVPNVFRTHNTHNAANSTASSACTLTPSPKPSARVQTAPSVVNPWAKQRNMRANALQHVRAVLRRSSDNQTSNFEGFARSESRKNENNNVISIGESHRGDKASNLDQEHHADKGYTAAHTKSKKTVHRSDHSQTEQLHHLSQQIRKEVVFPGPQPNKRVSHSQQTIIGDMDNVQNSLAKSRIKHKTHEIAGSSIQQEHRHYQANHQNRKNDILNDMSENLLQQSAEVTSPAKCTPFSPSTLRRQDLYKARSICTPAKLHDLAKEFSARQSHAALHAKQHRKQGILWKVLESGQIVSFDELVLIDSDLTVTPILNLKNKGPKYDPTVLSGCHFTTDEIVAMNDDDVHQFSARIMTVLELAPATRNRVRSAHRPSRGPSARPDKRRITSHMLAYLLHIVQDERVCNNLANSPVLPALCSGFHTAAEYNRERMAVLVGTIIRNTTLMFEDVDMSLMLHNLSDAVREFFRNVSLKRLLVSALGEALFYTVTQRLAATQKLPATWDIPSVALKMLFKCLSKDEDKSVQLAAARTVENMASVDGPHQEALRRTDVMLMLWRTLFYAHTAALRRACASAMLHLSFSDSGLFQHVVDKAGASSIVDLLQDTNHRVVQAILSCCILLFSETQPQKRGQMAIAETESTVSYAIRCLQQHRSTDLTAKIFMLLGCIQKVKPQSLERVCSSATFGIRTHSDMDIVLSELDRINSNVMVRDQQTTEESYQYLKQCASVFIQAALHWVVGFTKKLCELLSSVGDRQHPTASQSKELRELCDRYKLATTYMHSQVILQSLPSSVMHETSLHILHSVAKAMGGSDQIDAAGEEVGQALFTETAVALVQLTKLTNTADLRRSWPTLISAVGAFHAVGNQEMKQTAIQVYMLASEHIHAHMDWHQAQQLLEGDSTDIQEVLILVVQVLKNGISAPAACFHVLCDLWDAYHDVMSTFCTTIPELLDATLPHFQSIIDAMPPTDLSDEVMCNTVHFLDSASVVRNTTNMIACIMELSDSAEVVHLIKKYRLISKAVAMLCGAIEALSKHDIRDPDTSELAVFSLRASMYCLLLFLDFVLTQRGNCQALLPLFAPISSKLHLLLSAAPRPMIVSDIHLEPIKEFIYVFSSQVPERDGLLSFINDNDQP